jgi:predicted Fe-Mo cluster-binding NifX family protein
MSSKNYNYVVRGKNIKFIDNEAVKLLKKATGKIPQSGIRKFGNDAYVHRNGGWAHSCSALVKKGMKVYVVPSNKIEELYGSGAIGAVFEAIEDMYKDINNEFAWASEKVDSIS